MSELRLERGDVPDGMVFVDGLDGATESLCRGWRGRRGCAQGRLRRAGVLAERNIDRRFGGDSAHALLDDIGREGDDGEPRGRGAGAFEEAQALAEGILVGPAPGGERAIDNGYGLTADAIGGGGKSRPRTSWRLDGVEVRGIHDQVIGGGPEFGVDWGGTFEFELNGHGVAHRAGRMRWRQESTPGKLGKLAGEVLVEGYFVGRLGIFGFGQRDAHGEDVGGGHSDGGRVGVEEAAHHESKLRRGG